MLPSTGYDHQVAYRILDFCDPKVPWQRSLWTLGSLLSLHEALEAAQARAASVLSPASLEQICHTTSDTIIMDPGLGSLANRKLIYNYLRQTLVPALAEYDLLENVRCTHAVGYLGNWATHFALPVQQRVDADLASRLVASHLLDVGYS